MSKSHNSVWPMVALGALLLCYVLAQPAPRLAAEKQAGTTVYVSPNGNDNSGDGSAAKPYRGVQFALNVAAQAASEESPAKVRLAAGRYAEFLVVPPDVELIGADGNAPEATVIQPPDALTGAEPPVVRLGEGAALLDLSVQPPQDVDESTLVEIDCVQARVDNVVLDAGFDPFTTGLRAIGPGSSNSTVTRCVFANMDWGVDAYGSGIVVTRCVFDSISVAAVQADPTCSGGATPRLGNAANPATTGFNQMFNIGGSLVSLPSGGGLRAELNDWGVYDAQAVAGGMNVGESSGVFQDNIQLTLTDRASGQRILNGSIAIGGRNVTANNNGVYNLGNIPDGTGSICVSAPGYLSTDVAAVLSQGFFFFDVALFPDCGNKAAGDGDGDKGGVAGVDFEPFLKQGDLAVQPTVFVTVKNGDGAPVLTAAVGMDPGLFQVRDQVNGVYTIPLVAPGNYTVRASADGLGSGSKNVAVSAGASTVQVEVTLGEEQDDGGCR